MTNQKHDRKETNGLNCQRPSLTRQSICDVLGAIADEPVTCPATEQHTPRAGCAVYAMDSRRKGKP
ncbi:MAG: hypothetical protein EHM20_05385 [Alphaproteobacteria bacterium]|nr:MAG: hypothetical protein EHM20_05385 [Alphaproteobacteria bacterium]